MFPIPRQLIQGLSIKAYKNTSSQHSPSSPALASRRHASSRLDFMMRAISPASRSRVSRQSIMSRRRPTDSGYTPARSVRTCSGSNSTAKPGSLGPSTSKSRMLGGMFSSISRRRGIRMLEQCAANLGRNALTWIRLWQATPCSPPPSERRLAPLLRTSTIQQRIQMV